MDCKLNDWCAWRMARIIVAINSAKLWRSPEVVGATCWLVMQSRAAPMLPPRQALSLRERECFCLQPHAPTTQPPRNTWPNCEPHPPTPSDSIEIWLLWIVYTDLQVFKLPFSVHQVIYRAWIIMSPAPVLQTATTLPSSPQQPHTPTCTWIQHAVVLIRS